MTKHTICPNCGNATISSFAHREQRMRGQTVCHGNSAMPCLPIVHLATVHNTASVGLSREETDYLILTLYQHMAVVGIREQPVEDGSQMAAYGDTAFAQALVAKLMPFAHQRVTVTPELRRE